jgi:hypothetical protein
MKKKSIILFLFLITIQLFGQTKIKPKSNTQSKPEIDKLAEKYKETEVITLFTSHGDLIGDVEIDYNPDEKPQAVRISGKSINQDAISEFLSEIISQKEKQGYKMSNGDYEPSEPSWIKTMLGTENGVNYTLKKGQMYFICKGGFILDFSNTETKYWYSIETGDNSRKGGKKATKFDF